MGPTATLFNYAADDDIFAPAYMSVLSEQNREVLQKFLDKIPATISTLWGYEIRLRDVNLVSDFQVCVARTSNHSFSEFLSKVPYNNPLWRNFRDLTSCWINTEDPVHVLLKNIWLEMDASEMAADQPVPNFFFAPADGLDTFYLRKVVRHIFSILGIQLSEVVMNSLGHINDSLPTGAWVAQIGMMAARPAPQPVRLFVHNIAEGELPFFLERIGYSFAIEKLNGLLNEMYRLFDFIDVNVETEGEWNLHQIGLEGYVRIWTYARLEAVIKFLEAKALIDPRYRHKLMSYLLNASQPNGLYEEFIHHFKISYSDLYGCEAKLYLGVRRTNFSLILKR